VHFVSALKT